MATQTITPARRTSFSKTEGKKSAPVRRNKEIHAMPKTEYENSGISPELQARIEEAEKNCREGRCVTISSIEELDKYFNSI